MRVDPRARRALLSRRGVLRWAAALVALRGAAADDPIDANAVLESAAARILPSDDGPGAREARVGRFIERQLAGPLAELRPAFEALARLLDAWSRKAHGRGYAHLGVKEQDEVLAQLSRGAIPVRGFPQQAMFRALHSLVLEGFLSDPVHGGNHDQVGWRAIGFPEPHLRRPGGTHGH
jgi:gluconate 2-dehydrogenase gamma chain